MAKKKHSSKKSKAQSYDNMMGSPMQASNHPVNNIPDPTGGLHQGTGLDMMAGSPNPEDYGV